MDRYKILRVLEWIHDVHQLVLFYLSPIADINNYKIGMLPLCSGKFLSYTYSYSYNLYGPKPYLAEKLTGVFL